MDNCADCEQPTDIADLQDCDACGQPVCETCWGDHDCGGDGGPDEEDDDDYDE